MPLADAIRAAKRYAIPSSYDPSLVVGGDSVAVLSGASDTNWGIQSFMTQLHLQTFGGAIWNHNAGVGGNTSTALLARYDTDVIAKSPSVAIIEIGTNDMATIAQDVTLANIARMVTKNRQNGVRSLVLAIPPRDAYASQVVTRNRALRSLCRDMGVEYIDIHSALAQADGTYKTAYSAGDGIHPNVAGATLIAAIIKAATPGLWPVPGVISNFSQDASLLTNGANLTDSNADGLADGWTTFGSGTVTPSLVTRVAGASNWQELYSQAGTNNFVMQRLLTSNGGANYSPGDNIELFLRVEADQISAGVFTIKLIAADSGNATLETHTVLSTSGTTFVSFSDAAIYFPYTIPASTAWLKLNVTCVSGWQKVRVADYGIVKV